MAGPGRWIRSVLCLPLLLGLALAPLACSSSGKAPATESQPELSEAERLANVESFEHVWKTINDKFWDTEFGGVDWAAVREEYLPRVAAAPTMKEARKAMIEALDKLGQSHFYIIPSELYEDMGDGPRGSGDSGLRLRAVDGQAIVVKVIPGLPGEEAGIRPGWEILSARDVELAPFIAELAEEYAEAPNIMSKLSLPLRGKLRGEIGEELTLRLRDGEGIEHELSLVLARPVGVKTIFSNLPPTWVHFEARRLEGDIGYMAFNVFMAPPYLMTEFQKAIKDFKDCRGIVIDLRGNLGGIAGMAMGLSGWFIEEKHQRLGEMTTRTSRVNMLVNPRKRGYLGPLAILVDGFSASTSEFMAAGLRDLGRARIFGGRTAGAALPANLERLPNGDGFEYAIANYVSVSGARIEGNGIIPDTEAPYTRDSLLNGNDRALDAARAWINKENRSN